MSPSSAHPANHPSSSMHFGPPGGPHSGVVGELIAAADLAEREGRREQARTLYERALYGLTDPSQAPTASALLRWIGRTYQTDADLDAALDCHQAALAIAEASGDEAGIGLAVNMQATVHWQQGQLDEAERLYLRARDSAFRSGDAKLAAMTAQNLGVIANVRGELDAALHYYQSSLADYRALGLTRDECVALNNLGMLYSGRERWAEAERAYREALEMSTAIGDFGVRMRVELNIAEMYVRLRDFARAQEACDSAMDFSRRTQDAHAHGEAYKIYGVVAREVGDHAGAEEHFARASRIAEQRQDLLLSAETAREQADLHRRQGRNRETLQALNRAHRLFSSLRAQREVADVERQTASLEHEFLEVARRWSDSIESKDHYTQGHCERVADLACMIATRAGLDPKALFWFRIGALLHDVGKLIIPSEVLNKPGKLTPEEWELVKRHPAAGVEMLADVEFPWDVRPMVESHHERWDGAGYPHGLAGERIPYTARILCIADVYDALTSKRSYKAAHPHEMAMEIMRGDIGVQFDPELFRLFDDGMRPGHQLAMRPAAATGAPESAASAPPSEPDEVPLDDLTGLPLRRTFFEAAALALAEHAGPGLPVSLLVIDVDHFKLVNDTYGHLQGDEVLRTIAKLLRAQVRTGDLIARYAGDEFVALLPGAQPEAARQVAERMRVAVCTEKFAARGRESAAVAASLSIGVATAPQHGAGVEALFAAADRALYEAKRQGRDAVVVADVDAEAPKPALKLQRFVGRADELRRMVRLLEQSMDGSPQVVAISGEAGVGKSTLLRELAPEVRLRGGAVITGRCVEADVKPPYGPWADVINAARALGGVPGRSWRELPHLVPALGEEPAPAARGQQTGNKYALFQELSEYLHVVAAVRPLVIVLDDMQWADSASWDVLEHFVAQLERERVLICLTIRAEDAHGEAVDRRRRLSRDERFTEIGLQRLTRDDLKQWLDSVFPGQDLGSELLALLYRHTEGNPFVVLQVLRTLIEEGEIWDEGGRWAWRASSELRLPVAVSDLMSRRLARLSPEARGILTTAAVIGRVFDIDLAIAAGAGAEDDVLDAIDEAVGAAVLEPSHDGGGDRFAFSHALLVEAVRRGANPRRLKRIHARVAEAMEARTPAAAAEIAAHYDRGGAGGKAYQFALLAGARAKSVYAHDEATALLTMAERHAATPEQLAEARLRLADVAEAAGRYAEAEALCESVLAAPGGERAGERALPVRRTLARLRSLQGLPPQQTLEACRAMLAEAEAAGVEAECVALTTMISQAHGRLGDLAAAEALARESVRRAQVTGDATLLANALKRLGTTLLEVRPHEAIEFYLQALALCTETGDRYGQVRCHINTGVAYSRAGDEPAAEHAYRVALELGAAARAPDLAGVAALNLGVLYMKGGRYDEARVRYEEAKRLFETVKNEPHRLAALYNMAHLARERGEAAEALELYEATVRLGEAIGQADVQIGAMAGVGLAGLALGRGEVAARALRSADALMESKTDWWFQGRELLEALSVRIEIAGGDVALGERRFHAALALAERHDVYGAAWLVAECAPPLAAAGFSDVWEIVARYDPQVDMLGYAPLSTRYAAFSTGRA